MSATARNNESPQSVSEPLHQNKATRPVEWTDPFNSFNSWKGLMYVDYYKAILEERFLPPVEASIDPTYKCNVDCIWCNAQRILHENSKLGKSMSSEHLFELTRFLLSWGVRGFCFAGGGEPTLHPALWECMELISAGGGQNSIISNAININTRYKQEVAARNCRWVGVSLDAATPERFAQVKRTGAKMFNRVLDNIRAMVEIAREENTGCQVAAKFLIHPSNADQIYDAAVIARDLGVAHFHARPAASENIEGLGDVLDFPMDIINEQLARCMELETDTFKCFGVRHKFTGSFNLEHGFKRCLSAPLTIQCGADGNVYTCVDWRGSRDSILCRHDPHPEAILDAWGSPRHLEHMRNINIDKCPRCTYGVYARQIEQAVENDGMCVNFP